MRRYAVGALSRSLASSAADYNRVKSTGGLAALSHCLQTPDGQTQCYASGAVGVPMFVPVTYAGHACWQYAL